MKIKKSIHWAKCRYFLRCVFLASVGISSVFLLPFASGTKKKTERRTPYGTGVQTGSQMATYHDNCIFFWVFFVSDDFFAGLKQADTPAGKQFTKRKQIYRAFPDTVIVDVEAAALPCDASAQRLPSPDMASGLLGTLSIGASWRTDIPNPQPSALVPLKVERLNHGIRWDYFLEIPAKDIPLTTEMVIHVTAREHIELGTFSAKL
jgi:hypothetical protein